jgi:hypothetical protein
MLGGSDAECPDDIVVEVADCQGSHGALLLRMLSMHAYKGG